MKKEASKENVFSTRFSHPFKLYREEETANTKTVDIFGDTVFPGICQAYTGGKRRWAAGQGADWFGVCCQKPKGKSPQHIDTCNDASIHSSAALSVRQSPSQTVRGSPPLSTSPVSIPSSVSQSNKQLAKKACR